MMEKLLDGHDGWALDQEITFAGDVPYIPSRAPSRTGHCSEYFVCWRGNQHRANRWKVPLQGRNFFDPLYAGRAHVVKIPLIGNSSLRPAAWKREDHRHMILLLNVREQFRKVPFHPACGIFNSSNTRALVAEFYSRVFASPLLIISE